MNILAFSSTKFLVKNNATNGGGQTWTMDLCVEIARWSCFLTNLKVWLKKRKHHSCFFRPFHFSAGARTWDEEKTPHLLQLLFSSRKGEFLYHQWLLNLHKHYQIIIQVPMLNPSWKKMATVNKRGIWDDFETVFIRSVEKNHNFEKHQKSCRGVQEPGRKKMKLKKYKNR